MVNTPQYQGVQELGLRTKTQSGVQHNIKASSDRHTSLLHKNSSLTRIPDFCVALCYREEGEERLTGK